MNDDLKNTAHPGHEHGDNMSHIGDMDEAMANVLNTDDSISGNTLLEESSTAELEKLRGELEEMKDKHLRLIAEFDNFRRRSAKERIELTQTAGKDIIQSLLVVLDDMGRAEQQIENTTDIAAIKEGLALVFGKLRNILNAKGLKVMEAHEQEFNADLHEAITEVPAPSAKLKGKVLDVVEPGYYLNDKLIRYAKVVVGN